MNPFRPSVAALSIALASCAAPLALAQQIEEIVVTAQKRSQNIQDVSIAVTAFSGEQLERFHFDSAQEVTAMAPGVSTIQPNGEANYAIAMRGVATSDFTTNVESPVALYLDEVYISQMSGAGFSLFDMDRVEILRGPQGTLYGRNATGGLVHFVSNRPTQETSGYAKATVGDYGQFKAEGALGGAITDTLWGRVAAVSNQADGYVKNRLTGNDLNNADDFSWRAQLLWMPREDLDVLVSGRASTQDIDTGAWEHVTSNIPHVLTPDEVNVVTGYVDRGDSKYTGDYSRDGFNALDTDGLTLNARWTTEDFTLTSISDISHTERRYIEDSDASPMPLYNFLLVTKARQVSQELRLDGETERLKWVAGAYYLGLDITDANGSVTESFAGPVYAAYYPGVTRTPGAEAGFLNPYESELDSWSGFGQLEYALTDSVSLIGGARYIADDRSIDYRIRAVEFLQPYARQFDAADNLANRRTLGSYEGEREDGEWSAKAQLDWTPSDDLLVYAGWSLGIRGGGFNAPIDPLLVYSDEIMSYDPERLHAWEVGVKKTLMDGLLQLNGSAYWYDYQDYQSFYMINFFAVTFNADATSRGAEIELIASPIDGLDILLGASHINVEVDLPDGSQTPSVQSPPWSFNAMVRYAYELELGTLSAQVDTVWRDRHYFALTQYETVEEDAYAVTNVSLGYTSPDARWEGAVFLENALDEEYVLQSFDLSGPAVFGMTERYYGKPRWWGVSLRYNL